MYRFCTAETGAYGPRRRRSRRDGRDSSCEPGRSPLRRTRASMALRQPHGRVSAIQSLPSRLRSVQAPFADVSTTSWPFLAHRSRTAPGSDSTRRCSSPCATLNTIPASERIHNRPSAKTARVRNESCPGRRGSTAPAARASVTARRNHPRSRRRFGPQRGLRPPPRTVQYGEQLHCPRPRASRSTRPARTMSSSVRPS